MLPPLACIPGKDEWFKGVLCLAPSIMKPCLDIAEKFANCKPRCRSAIFTAFISYSEMREVKCSIKSHPVIPYHSSIHTFNPCHIFLNIHSLPFIYSYMHPSLTMHLVPLIYSFIHSSLTIHPLPFICSSIHSSLTINLFIHTFIPYYSSIHSLPFIYSSLTIHPLPFIL